MLGHTQSLYISLEVVTTSLPNRTVYKKKTLLPFNLHLFNDNCNGVTSNDFVTFKISVTSNCNGTVTKKNG